MGVKSTSNTSKNVYKRRGMVGVSVYVLTNTLFLSLFMRGRDGLAVLNLILPVYGLIYAIGSMIGIGSATRYGINKAKGEKADHYFTQAVAWSVLISIPFVLLGILFWYNVWHCSARMRDWSQWAKLICRLSLWHRRFLCQIIQLRHLQETIMRHPLQWQCSLQEVFLILCSTIFLFFRSDSDSPVRHLQRHFVRLSRCPSV